MGLIGTTGSAVAAVWHLRHQVHSWVRVGQAAITSVPMLCLDKFVLPHYPVMQGRCCMVLLSLYCFWSPGTPRKVKCFLDYIYIKKKKKKDAYLYKNRCVYINKTISQTEMVTMLISSDEHNRPRGTFWHLI